MLTALYTAIFSFRRLLMVLALLFFVEDKSTLLYAFLAIFSLNFAYLAHANANCSTKLNKLEIFNELCQIGVIYTMIFFV